MADKGGWSSKGRKFKCRRCGNDDATLLESTIYGRTSRHVFCNVCSKDWIERERDEDDGDSER